MLTLIVVDFEPGVKLRGAGHQTELIHVTTGLTLIHELNFNIRTSTTTANVQYATLGRHRGKCRPYNPHKRRFPFKRVHPYRKLASVTSHWSPVGGANDAAILCPYRFAWLPAPVRPVCLIATVGVFVRPPSVDFSWIPRTWKSGGNKVADKNTLRDTTVTQDTKSRRAPLPYLLFSYWWWDTIRYDTIDLHALIGWLSWFSLLHGFAMESKTEKRYMSKQNTVSSNNQVQELIPSRMH